MNTTAPPPMACTSVRSKLSAYADNEVSAALRLAMEAHLAACADCRQALAALQHLWVALEDAPLPQPRPGFAHEILQKLAEKPEPKLFPWVWDRMLPSPAVMAAMVVAGLLFGGWMGRAAMEDPGAAATAQGQSAMLEALDAFAPIPKGSLAQGYLLLASDATRVQQ